jgi:hypothetical protein
MLEINDYSSRRGVLVPLFPKIHAMLKENSERDKFSNLEPPEHLIIWQQKIRQVILDINRRFIVAMDGGNLAGIFFYRIGKVDGVGKIDGIGKVDGNEGKIFIEDVQAAWSYRNNTHIIDGFLKKLEFDKHSKDATFYASQRIKIDYDKELLAAKGFKTVHEDGWEKLGTYSQAAGAIKIRYNRGVGV